MFLVILEVALCSMVIVNSIFLVSEEEIKQSESLEFNKSTLYKFYTVRCVYTNHYFVWNNLDLIKNFWFALGSGFIR